MSEGALAQMGCARLDLVDATVDLVGPGSGDVFVIGLEASEPDRLQRIRWPPIADAAHRLPKVERTGGWRERVRRQVRGT